MQAPEGLSVFLLRSSRSGRVTRVGFSLFAMTLHGRNCHIKLAPLLSTQNGQTRMDLIYDTDTITIIITFKDNDNDDSNKIRPYTIIHSSVKNTSDLTSWIGIDGGFSRRCKKTCKMSR